MSDNDDSNDNDDNQQQSSSLQQPSKLTKPSSINYFWSKYSNKLKLLQFQIKIKPNYKQYNLPKITYRTIKDTLSWNTLQKNNWKIKLEKGKTKLSLNVVDHTKQKISKQPSNNEFNKHPPNQPSKNIDIILSTSHHNTKLTTHLTNKSQFTIKFIQPIDIIPKIIKTNLECLFEYKTYKNIQSKLSMEIFYYFGMRKWVFDDVFRYGNRTYQLTAIDNTSNAPTSLYYKNQSIIKAKLTTRQDYQLKCNTKHHFGWLTQPSLSPSSSSLSPNPPQQKNPSLQQQLLTKTQTQLKLLLTKKQQQQHTTTFKSFFHLQYVPLKQVFKFSINKTKQYKNTNLLQSNNIQLKYACKYWHRYLIGLMLTTDWTSTSHSPTSTHKWQTLFQKQQLFTNKDHLSASLGNNHTGIKYKNKFNNNFKIEITYLKKLWNKNKNMNSPNFGIKVFYNL